MGRREALPPPGQADPPRHARPPGALTADRAPGDNLMIHSAIEHARPGDVLVVDAKGYVEAGAFGGVLAVAGRAREIAGIVGGRVRGGAPLAALDFPAFPRARYQGDGQGGRGPGRRLITRAGIPVAPGDVVVPRAATAVLPAAEDRGPRRRGCASGSWRGPRRGPARMRGLLAGTRRGAAGSDASPCRGRASRPRAWRRRAPPSRSRRPPRRCAGRARPSVG